MSGHFLPPQTITSSQADSPVTVAIRLVPSCPPPTCKIHVHKQTLSIYLASLANVKYSEREWALTAEHLHAICLSCLSFLLLPSEHRVASFAQQSVEGIIVGRSKAEVGNLAVVAGEYLREMGPGKRERTGPAGAAAERLSTWQLSGMRRVKHEVQL